MIKRLQELRIALVVGCFVIIATMSGDVFAKQTLPSGLKSGGVVDMRFRNSATGAVVMPDSVLIDGREMREGVDETGRLTLMLPDGRYPVEVRATHYDLLVTEEVVEGKNTLPNTILLDPLVVPEEISSERLRMLRNLNVSVVVGYVTDEETGTLLSDVEVRIPFTDLKTTTDERGFFALSVPIFEISPENLAKTEILFSKSGYVTQERREVTLLPGTEKIYTVSLLPGDTDTRTILDESEERGDIASWIFDERRVVPKPEDLVFQDDGSDGVTPETEFSPAARPTSIRVGFTSSGGTCCSSCSKVSTINIETYVKHVLPAEWIASWNANSLRAGAVAIRSYGGWHVYHPKTSTYDICSNACCQVYGSATYSSSNSATNYTKGLYMLDSSNNIARTEYSAENNNTGCGDCKTGTCLSDKVCCGYSANGHGRGMCQWGSQRWAIGATNSGGAKSYTWILDHYYAQYNWHRGK